MKKFIISAKCSDCWIVVATDKHAAIAKAVEAGYSDSMADFYYGFEDGQIQIMEVKREIE